MLHVRFERLFFHLISAGDEEASYNNQIYLGVFPSFSLNFIPTTGKLFITAGHSCQ